MSQSTELKILGRSLPESEAVLTKEALAFVRELEKEFGPRRRELLKAREARLTRIKAGEKFDFLAETKSVRESSYKVKATPKDLQDRRVEITGPAEPKMMINALNCGAKVFMADLEDALSPTWERVVQGQKAIQDAVRRTLTFSSGDKKYSLNEKLATLIIRPRGWHLNEKNAEFEGKAVSGSLFDFGLCFFHNAKEQLTRGTGPYFYLPKIESHKEARLWADVFRYSEKRLGVKEGSVCATVLIETLPAAFEMDEILFELKDYIVGLNAGRWDYIFSCIKKMIFEPNFMLPDRVQVSMAVPFMSSYSKLLVETCHKRGAHAMGGMAAFVPSRKDAVVNENAFAKVREDKEREAKLGFDGTWVAHPDLVAVAIEKFNEVLGDRPNQKEKLPVYGVKPSELIDFRIEGGKITEGGIRNNINVALLYTEKWLGGVGAVALHNLMEDAATAEISRAQLWLWVKKRAQISDGRVFGPEMFQKLLKEEFEKVSGDGLEKLNESRSILEKLVLNETFEEFLTLPAYEQIN